MDLRVTQGSESSDLADPALLATELGVELGAVTSLVAEASGAVSDFFGWPLVRQTYQERLEVDRSQEFYLTVKPVEVEGFEVSVGIGVTQVVTAELLDPQRGHGRLETGTSWAGGGRGSRWVPRSRPGRYARIPIASSPVQRSDFLATYTAGFYQPWSLGGAPGPAAGRAVPAQLSGAVRRTVRFHAERVGKIAPAIPRPKRGAASPPPREYLPEDVQDELSRWWAANHGRPA